MCAVYYFINKINTNYCRIAKGRELCVFSLFILMNKKGFCMKCDL